MPINERKDGYYWGSKGPFKLRKRYNKLLKASSICKERLANYFKKGTKKRHCKKPQGSTRRLYTDENPKDTVPVKFKTAQDVRETFSSSAFKNKPHKRQSQIINLVEQRARVALKGLKTLKRKRD